MTLALLLLLPAFSLGVLVGRPARVRWDVKCLPDPSDERWVLAPEAECFQCNIHKTRHEQLRLGSVIVENHCGATVGGSWTGKATKQYAESVFARHVERKALASWGES